MTDTDTARILVVDDHAEMAVGLADYLRGHGDPAEAAAGGAEAVRKVTQSAFDVAITDLKMKDPDGMAVLEAVHKADPSVPVFIMTAYRSIENATAAIRPGAFHYFSKPLKSGEVRLHL